MMLDLKTIEAWAKNETLLERGMVNQDVSVLQALLEKFGLYDMAIDDKFYGGTEASVEKFQWLRCLTVDGKAGKNTKGAMLDAYISHWPCNATFKHPDVGILVYGPKHPECGVLESTEGRMSTFGGQNDWGDRTEGQKYITGADSPAELMEKHPELVELGILRTDYDDPSFYPVVDSIYGRKKADTSWCLDPDSYFCAMRWYKKGAHLRNEDNPRLLISRGNVGVVCLRTDWGPASRTKRAIDLSDGADKILPGTTDTWVKITWVPSNTPLGPISL